MKTVTMEVEPGAEIYSASRKAVALAHRNCCRVKFVFNGILMLAHPDSDPDQPAADYNREHELRRKQTPSSLAIESPANEMETLRTQVATLQGVIKVQRETIERLMRRIDSETPIHPAWQTAVYPAATPEPGKHASS